MNRPGVGTEAGQVSREETETSANAPQQGSAAEVFRAFLALGLTSFGGPVSHLAYFHDAFVVRRKWIGGAAYADLVALCQFLPGPASSQVGMAIGLGRAGYLGMLAAWAAFTLPSAILLVAFAWGAAALDPEAGGWIEGLKAAAVAVVAQAVVAMAASLAPDRERATVAVAAMIAAMLWPTAVGQVLAIVAGGLVGLVWLRPSSLPQIGRPEALAAPVGKAASAVFLVVFAILLVALPLFASSTGNPLLGMIDSFYRAGSLVFGGGHVVLPLLEAEVVETGRVGEQAFLAGYGAAQAVPGPLFAFAAYLGALSLEPPSGLVGAAVALLAIYLPSALLILGVLPFWEGLRQAPAARRALFGVNAAVVGLLAAALYDPVFMAGITSGRAMAIAAAAFVSLSAWKAPPWAVVVAAGLAGFLIL